MTMSVSGFFLLPLLLAALAVVSSTASAAAGGGGTVIRMQVSHADAGRGLSRHELLRRMALRSSSRAARLLAGTSASAPVTPGEFNASDPGSEYLVHLGIGTPLQPVQLTLDTGSDLIWTQCQPCTSCFPQPLPYFDPSASSTFQQLACGAGSQTCPYGYSYGDNSVTSGQLVADTFVFDDQGQKTAVSNLTFGCGLNNSGIFTSNETGIAGFGRGAQSLPSQLKVDNFSYCFTNIAGSTPSPVLLGLPADLASSGGAAVQTTPLIQSSSQSGSSYYYLQLQGITVGSTTLPVPASAFALNADGSGGTIIDSGTSFTSLPPDVYSLLRTAFASELNMMPVAVTSAPGFLCFPAASAVPTLELQFDGATLNLPPENYVLAVDDENGVERYMCIAIGSSGGNMTIIGNYQQQNMYVIYDLAGETLSFVPAKCDMV